MDSKQAIWMDDDEIVDSKRAVEKLRHNYKTKAHVMWIDAPRYADMIEQQAALIERQERLLGKAIKKIANTDCIVRGMCPENYVEAGCEPCVRQWLESEADDGKLD